MLQRMSEDLEFSECRTSSLLPCEARRLTLCVPVDAAAAQPDPARRIAYVAAFAMSNYSSTIGRIAKPFNPMLVSLTFSFVHACIDQDDREKRLNTSI